MENRLHTNDKVEIIDEGSPRFGKTGIVEEAGIRPLTIVNQEPTTLTYVKVRLDDNIVVTFTDLERPIPSQLKKLE